VEAYPNTPEAATVVIMSTSADTSPEPGSQLNPEPVAI
jgi:hypothetical protein